MGDVLYYHLRDLRPGFAFTGSLMAKWVSVRLQIYTFSSQDFNPDNLRNFGVDFDNGKWVYGLDSYGENLAMEGNLSAGNRMLSASYGVVDLQESMHVHHQQHPHILHQQQHSHPHQGSIVHPPIHNVFPLMGGRMHECDQPISIPVYNKGERGKNSTSDEDEPSFTEDGIDGHTEAGRGKKGSPWQRMKWTDSMVRLLITIVSYSDDVASECSSGGRRKSAILQKKGKWKSVSKVMAERGCYVSPQQCEDKFNDLNKRYKRLTDVLGRGTSCKVVENPVLLDMMNNLSEKAKEDVRKILSSKHLFYEEMCSYHNGNRLHLPTDPALQHSLQLALRSRDDHDIQDTRRHPQDDIDEEDQDVETDDRDDEAEENHALHGDNGGAFGMPGGFAKRLKQGQDHEDVSFGNPLRSQDCNKISQVHPQNIPADMNQVSPEGTKAAWLQQKQWMRSRSLQLEEQKFEIQVQMLELEKQRFKWQKFSRKKDRELDKLRMENERMKFENGRIMLELKRKEMDADFN
ncbi:hypothetical protein HHK36_009309 [Tetracentron sinense]|uniref:Myb/SANT-like DNA-binding domain-containing protein n=1 Tax=Tetracentron sinense TaxID=13715 RepID=A0A834ZAN4_TETSI|nr:hypothetical protein HHK36_009309 [Tetracentron sinense]